MSQVPVYRPGRCHAVVVHHQQIFGHRYYLVVMLALYTQACASLHALYMQWCGNIGKPVQLVLPGLARPGLAVCQVPIQSSRF